MLCALFAGVWAVTLAATFVVDSLPALEAVYPDWDLDDWDECTVLRSIWVDADTATVLMWAPEGQRN